MFQKLLPYSHLKEVALDAFAIEARYSATAVNRNLELRGLFGIVLSNVAAPRLRHEVCVADIGRQSMIDKILKEMDTPTQPAAQQSTGNVPVVPSDDDYLFEDTQAATTADREEHPLSLLQYIDQET
ncbi:hypothetical protein QR680_007434 [Steinernema hermaphroditum]|uniref:Uncharacterized protein n=1 Tax=Steinernema hermaphroditum TaxID=289476 RepID=A0AA39M6E4_9BILA|nr:hypothetical protein QR680_007434 [Steinernema hermaphroditum]